MFDDLASGRVDVAVSPRAELPDLFHSITVSKHRIILMCSPTSPVFRAYATNGRPVDMASLTGERICTMENGAVRRLFPKDVLGRNEVVTLPSMLAAIPYVLKQNFIALCGENSYRLFFRKYGLESIPVVNLQPTHLPIRLFWHHRVHKDPAQQWFRSVLVNIIKRRIQNS